MEHLAKKCRVFRISPGLQGPATVVLIACCLLMSGSAQSQTVSPPKASAPDSPPLITLEVTVRSKGDILIPNLKQEYFRVSEDGVPQTIVSFKPAPAPARVALLEEFANHRGLFDFNHDAGGALYSFVQSLRKDDWMALLTYDTKMHIVEDFTQDKRSILGGWAALLPGSAMSSDTNLFDALYSTLDRLDAVAGPKYIVLISTGRDTFSIKTLDQVLKKIQSSRDTVIYSVDIGQPFRNYAETHGLPKSLCPFTGADAMCETEFARGHEQMQRFAKMSGGWTYTPVFNGQIEDELKSIGEQIQNHYQLSYRSSGKQAGYRKIKVELIDDHGLPLKMRDLHGQEIVYGVQAREGYLVK
ncbi:MAG: VWA domain-containing protein [Acidobacteria bacterium]|nr:VWA domain-containing protein [Acidobacteriota bacterium]